MGILQFFHWFWSGGIGTQVAEEICIHVQTPAPRIVAHSQGQPRLECVIVVRPRFEAFTTDAEC